jgi:uncharacterized protein YggU (UPF0235/DUF167 family)
MSMRRNKTGKCSPAQQAEIKVKVIPRSSCNLIAGKEGDTYRVKVTAAPVNGMANGALLDLLAKRLRVGKGSITIKSGQNARLKHLLVSGLSAQEVNARLESSRLKA